MSKDLHNNERYLKELADTLKPVPPTLVWDEIEQVLDKDKGKRRSFPILWIFGVLLMGATMFINLRGKKDKESPMVQQETTISNYQKQNDPNSLDISTVDSEAISELKQGRNANISETLPPVSDNQEKKKVYSEKLNSFVTQQHQSNNLNASTLDRSLKVNTINSNVSAMITKEDILRPRMFSQSTESALKDRQITQITALPRLKWMQILFEAKGPLPDPSENLTFILSSESKGNPSQATPWFVELGGGIGRNLSNSVLLDPTQGEFRLNTESRWYSWSTSFRLGYQFDNLWYTTIGIDLNQTKNRFDFWRRDVSSLLVGQNQNFQITKSNFFNIGETRYTFVDLGLSIGKRVNIDKWHFSLEGGPIFNFLFNANGKVQVGGIEFSRLEDQEEYFNTQIGIGARLSAMLDYPISEQLWISMGPIYHQYFNTVSSDENPLEERNAIIQVRASVRYHF